jgi:hypothetical protein
MNGITVDEVASKPKASPKASKAAISQTEPKPPNAMLKALRDAATSPRSWTVITCVLLTISGSVRYVRDWGLSNRMAAAKQSPFPLEEIPKSLGPWRMISEANLDPEITQLAGASDHITRNYVNDKTGEVVTVLVMYGLAYALHGHIAEICYPAAGYKAIDSLKTYELRPAKLDKVMSYQGGYFSKKRGAADEYDEVIYSFRYVGQWTANARPNWKSFRRFPGMYKVQIARQATEFAVETSPSLPLLEDIVTEIENRLSKASVKLGETAAADQATPKKI